LINPVIQNDKSAINVLDFGGACGAHYFELRALTNRELKLNWIVIETPTMVEHAKALTTDELSFSDNLTDVVNKFNCIDLLHTSGTLQCVDNPWEYLNKILNSQAQWLLFNRLGLNKINRDVITIHSSKLSQNGIGKLPEGYKDKKIYYPFTFLSEDKFIKTLKEKYNIIAKFNDTSGMYPVMGEKITGYGLLCKKRSL